MRDLFTMKVLNNFLFISFLLVISSMSVLGFSGGDGSQGNPYQITNCSQLQEMNGNTSILYYSVMNDIDCSGESYSSVTLYGILDGNGYTVSNLNFTGNGIFNVIQGTGVVNNINYENIIMITTSVAGVIAYEIADNGVATNIFVNNVTTITTSPSTVQPLVRMFRAGLIENVTIYDATLMQNKLNGYSSGTVEYNIGGTIKNVNVDVKLTKYLNSPKVTLLGQNIYSNSHYENVFINVDSSSLGTSYLLKDFYSTEDVTIKNVNIKTTDLDSFYYTSNLAECEAVMDNTDNLLTIYDSGDDFDTLGISNVIEITDYKDLTLYPSSYDSLDLLLYNSLFTNSFIGIDNGLANNQDILFPFQFGAGTSVDPYKISDCETFLNINSITSEYSYFELTNNISCNGYIYQGQDLNGDFNGNGYTISDIDTTGSDVYNSGLFKTLISNSNLYNFTYENFNIVQTSTSNNGNAGLVYITETNTTVHDIYMNHGYVRGDAFVGAIIGTHNGDMERVYAEDITIKNIDLNYYSGGIASTCRGVINNVSLDFDSQKASNNNILFNNAGNGCNIDNIFINYYSSVYSYGAITYFVQSFDYDTPYFGDIVLNLDSNSYIAHYEQIRLYSTRFQNALNRGFGHVTFNTALGSETSVVDVNDHSSDLATLYPQYYTRIEVPDIKSLNSGYDDLDLMLSSSTLNNEVYITLNNSFLDEYEYTYELAPYITLKGDNVTNYNYYENEDIIFGVSFTRDGLPLTDAFCNFSLDKVSASDNVLINQTFTDGDSYNYIFNNTLVDGLVNKTILLDVCRSGVGVGDVTIESTCGIYSNSVTTSYSSISLCDSLYTGIELDIGDCINQTQDNVSINIITTGTTNFTLGELKLYKSFVDKHSTTDDRIYYNSSLEKYIADHSHYYIDNGNYTFSATCSPSDMPSYEVSFNQNIYVGSIPPMITAGTLSSDCGANYDLSFYENSLCGSRLYNYNDCSSELPFDAQLCDSNYYLDMPVIERDDFKFSYIVSCNNSNSIIYSSFFDLGRDLNKSEYGIITLPIMDLIEDAKTNPLYVPTSYPLNDCIINLEVIEYEDGLNTGNSDNININFNLVDNATPYCSLPDDVSVFSGTDLDFDVNCYDTNYYNVIIGCNDTNLLGELYYNDYYGTNSFYNQINPTSDSYCYVNITDDSGLSYSDVFYITVQTDVSPPVCIFNPESSYLVNSSSINYSLNCIDESYMTMNFSCSTGYNYSTDYLSTEFTFNTSNYFNAEGYCSYIVCDSNGYCTTGQSDVTFYTPVDKIDGTDLTTGEALLLFIMVITSLAFIFMGAINDIGFYTIIGGIIMFAVGIQLMFVIPTFGAIFSLFGAVMILYGGAGQPLDRRGV